ncbi:hypothetical protein HDV00_008706 [Rhizophlyctis rosea]|nr:hypothetical protein HDV00_008706 [Rhizophlyctis rosea]
MVSVLSSYAVEKYGELIDFRRDDDAAAFKIACDTGADIQTILQKYHFNDVEIIAEGCHLALKLGHEAIWQQLLLFPGVLQRVLYAHMVVIQSNTILTQIVDYMVLRNLDPNGKLQLAIITACIRDGLIFPLDLILAQFPAVASDNLNTVNRWLLLRTACLADSHRALSCLEERALLPQMGLSELGGILEFMNIFEAYRALEFFESIVPRVIDEAKDPSPSDVVSISETLIRCGTTEMLVSVLGLWDYEMESGRYLEYAVRQGKNDKAMILLRSQASMTPAHLELIVYRILDGELDRDVLPLAFRNLVKRNLDVDLSFLSPKV